MVLAYDKLVRSDVYATEFVTENMDRFVIALADGMGGHNAGEVASSDVLSNLQFQIIPNMNIKMYQYQVSQGLYEFITKLNPSKFEGANLPVENVSWYDAILFCNQLSIAMGLLPVYQINNKKVTINNESKAFRLPSVEEWQIAAKGEAGYLYSGSIDIDLVGWYSVNSHYSTHEVGEKMANQYGLYDMSGNVWEWCWDGTNNEDVKFVCGGSWKSKSNCCRIDSVRRCRATAKKNNIGFRIVQSI